MRVTIDGLARLFGSDDRVLRAVRNTGLSLVNRWVVEAALIRQRWGSRMERAEETIATSRCDSVRASVKISARSRLAFCAVFSNAASEFH